ncbi:hypothetical protein ACFQXB_06905 [Plastorhodobacter daqingensis]|uniref:Uncharacterized protein n=1 Tax=Plastorhodobacter daqingensis TaxID=1387281 RepID=A0ABW2UKF6_9RHOB
MRFPLLMALCLLPLTTAAAHAETPMTGAEFEREVTGRTLTYGTEGVPYGVEQYLPNREVIWSFIGQECRRGSWYEVGEDICFTYEHDPTPQCWRFFQTPEGLRARFMDGAGGGGDLIEVDRSPAPLYCPGPDIGV